MAKRKTVPDQKKSTRELRCQLTDKERLEIAQAMADAITEISTIKAQIKGATSELKIRLAQVQAALNEQTHVLRAGYIYRSVSCTELLGVPEPSKKQIIRDDTGEVAAIEKLNEQEMQRELLEVDPPEPAPAA